MTSKTSCNVYWVHLPEHTDISTEGYIGITIKTVAKRFAQHKVGAKRGDAYTFSNAIVKHGKSLVCTTLLQGSVDYCRYIENKLRPAPNVGWNINIGGDVPPMSGRTHTLESRARMSASNNRELSRQRAVTNNNGRFQGKDWESGKYTRRQWHNAKAIYETIAQFPKAGHRKIHTLSLLSKEIGDIKQVFDKIKTGWNPYLDSKYELWFSGTK